MRKIVLYIASSLDGFIASEDGSVEWLSSDKDSVYDGDYGYQDFYDSVDTLLMGRRTYEQIKGFGKWPYSGKGCYVFTRRVDRDADNNISFIGDPVHFTRSLKAEKGDDIWLVGGSEIISLLWNEGLIDEIILTILPLILGSGISLFKSLNNETRLKLKRSKAFETGFVQNHYEIVR